MFDLSSCECQSVSDGLHRYNFKHISYQNIPSFCVNALPGGCNWLRARIKVSFAISRTSRNLVIENMLHIPQPALEVRVAAVLYPVQTASWFMCTMLHCVACFVVVQQITEYQASKSYPLSYLLHPKHAFGPANPS